MAEYVNKETFLSQMGLVGDETKYGNRDAEQQERSYSTWMGYEIMDSVDNCVEEDVVKVVHGRWVHPKGYVVSNGFLCSECNHEVTSYHVIHPLGNGTCKADEHGNFFYPPKINYCPNCGAKMDGGNDNASDQS